MLAPRTRSIPNFSLTLRALAVMLIVMSATANVRAQTDPRKEAGRAFDEGVAAFDRAAYADAARAFLRADGLAPSRDALQNALTAARRANEHMLVVSAAERALAREATEPKLAISARQALAEAAQHLAKVDLKCEPLPCDLSIDGQPVEAGQRYLLPGTHSLSAKAEQATADKSLTFAAGTAYTVLLHPAKPGEKERPAEVKSKKVEAPPQKDEATKRKPLPVGFFYAGVGVTLVLAGITTWSGLDALSAKNDLPAEPTKKQVTDVRNKTTRTDIFLAATVLVGGLTTYAGIALVDFGGKKEKAQLVLGPSSVSVVGAF
jgi:hypothetical protein